jgi:hypothetical protein
MLSLSTSKGPVVFVLDPEVEKRVKIETGMRRSILDMLYKEPRTVSQLSRELGVSNTTTSHHLLRMLEDDEVEIVRGAIEKNLPQEKYYRAIARRVTIKAPPAELGQGRDSFENNLANVIAIGLFKLMEIYKDQLPSLDKKEELSALFNGALLYESLTVAGIMPYLLEFISKISDQDMKKFFEVNRDFFYALAEGKQPVQATFEKLHKLGLKTLDEADERVREYYAL